MGVAGGTEELEGQQGAQGATGRDHLRTGEARPVEDAVEGDRRQAGEEEEHAAALGAEGARGEVELADVGDVGGRGARAGRALLVEPPGQAGVALGLEEGRDGGRAEGVAFVAEGGAAVVEGEVLLAQGDHAVAEPVLLGGRSGPFGRGEEEGPLGALTELMDQDAKAAGGVAEASGGLGGGKPLDEVSAEGLVLAVGRVDRLEEAVGKRR
jgi:hypothetical protein